MEDRLSPTISSHIFKDRLGRQRVVISGLGAITPLANNMPDSWTGLISGRSGAGPITVLDASEYTCQIAAELKGFEPERYINKRQIRHMPTAAQIAVAAAYEAIEDSGLSLDKIDPSRSGVLIGTAAGSSVEETEHATKQLVVEKGRLSPFQVLRFWPNMPAFFVAQAFGFRGYNSSVCTACAAGTQAIAEAAKIILYGDADIMLAGGTDHMVAETVLAGFTAMRALAVNYNHEPHRAMRPFEADREGFIVGGGSAMLLLERMDLAMARGAKVYAEVLGSGITNDAFHMIAPDPEGKSAARAMLGALEDAGLSPDDVDYINAHAASTQLGDAAETKAIKRVFAENAYKIPISSTKSMVGHLMGAAGALEAAVCAMTLVDGIVHPTINYEKPDPECDLDYVPNEARPTKAKIAMSNSIGLGGQNASLLLGRL